MQAVKELEVSQKTLIDWYRFCWDIGGFHNESEEVSNTKIEVVGRIVEIKKKRYQYGRVAKKTCFSGSINRNNKEETFVLIVPDRSKKSLLEVNFY